MRIDAYNQIAQIYKTNKAGKVTSAASASSARDELQISSFGRDFQIRTDKVADLKAKVDAGNYHVDNGDFASKLLEKYNALGM